MVHTIRWLLGRCALPVITALVAAPAFAGGPSPIDPAPPSPIDPAPPSPIDPAPVLGDYSGIIQGKEQSCPDASDDDTFSEPAFLSIDQGGSSFRGSGVAGDAALSVEGELFPGGTATVYLDYRNGDGVTGSVMGSGTFDGSRLNFSFSGSDSNGCVVTGDAHLSRQDDVLFSSASAGSEVTQGAELEASMRGGLQSANSTRTRMALKGGGTGALAINNGFMLSGSAAGEEGPRFGAWLGFTQTDSKNDFSTVAYKADRRGFLFGVDTSPSEDWLVGVSFALESSDIDTRFNGGEQDVRSYTLAPYVGILINDWLSFDATVGYSNVDIDQFRIAATTGARISSKVEGDRFFASANLAATRGIGNLLLTGLAGMQWAKQRDDSFEESNGVSNPSRSSRIGRLLAGGEVAYALGAWEPYLSALFEYDFSRTRLNLAPGQARPKDDDSDVLMGLGVRYFDSSGVSAALEYSSVLGRSHVSEDTISANVRWAF